MQLLLPIFAIPPHTVLELSDLQKNHCVTNLKKPFAFFNMVFFEKKIQMIFDKQKNLIIFD